jgi:hypothetical protein
VFISNIHVLPNGHIVSSSIIYLKIQRPGPPGLGLDARLTTLLYKKINVTKSKEMEIG